MAEEKAKPKPIVRTVEAKTSALKEPEAIRTEVETVAVEVADEEVNKSTVMYLLYLLYKGNHLTRMHLKKLLATIKEEHPKDIIEYLVKEAAK